MTAADTRTRIKRVIVKSLMLEGLKPEEIGDEQPLFGEGLGLDSVDALELVLGLEQEFGIQVKSDRIERDAFACVSTLAAWVERHQAAAAAKKTAAAT
jgi:acyl carrier protein